MDDDMDPNEVEESQDRMNGPIEDYHDMAVGGQSLDARTIKATPYTQ